MIPSQSQPNITSHYAEKVDLENNIKKIEERLNMLQSQRDKLYQRSINRNSDSKLTEITFS